MYSYEFVFSESTGKLQPSPHFAFYKVAYQARTSLDAITTGVAIAMCKTMLFTVGFSNSFLYTQSMLLSFIGSCLFCMEFTKCCVLATHDLEP